MTKQGQVINCKQEGGEMIKINTENKRKMHSEAVELVLDYLPDAINAREVSFSKRKKYDILWDDKKLNVMISTPTKKSSQKRTKWFYTLYKKNWIADYYVLLALVNDKVAGVFVLPCEIAPTRYITINRVEGNMKYDYFKTGLENLPKKIIKIEKRLPTLKKIKKDQGGL